MKNAIALLTLLVSFSTYAGGGAVGVTNCYSKADNSFLLGFIGNPNWFNVGDTVDMFFDKKLDMADAKVKVIDGLKSAFSLESEGGDKIVLNFPNGSFSNTKITINHENEIKNYDAKCIAP